MRARYGPSGVHGFDRATGINVLVDEVVVPADAWSEAPRFLSLALTNACELACPHCYAPKHAARLRREEVLAWCGEMDAHGAHGVGFGGGEPTLYPGFAGLCRDVHGGTGLAVTFTTHGHRFTERLVDELLGSVDFIRLSMDGVGATYERLRGRRFDAFLRQLAIVRATAPFGINFVVNAHTVADLDAAAEVVRDEGATELLLLPELAPGGASALDDATARRVVAWVEAHQGRVRLATSDAGRALLGAPTLPVADGREASFDFLHVDASGILRGCAFRAGGVRVAEHGSLMTAIRALRAGAPCLTVEAPTGASAGRVH